MITMCYAAKGGSGTTLVACSRAIGAPRPTLLVDLCGDAPLMLGLAEPERPGVIEWLHSNAPASHLDDLTIDLTPHCTLLPAHSASHTSSAPPQVDIERWIELAAWLADTAERSKGQVIIDAGTQPLPAEVTDVCTHRWLVTRACYLSIKRAIGSPTRPTGIVLVDEPGRGLRPNDLETSIGAPIVAKVAFDPLVFRAVDAGLLSGGRLPRSVRRALAHVA